MYLIKMIASVLALKYRLNRLLRQNAGAKNLV